MDPSSLKKCTILTIGDPHFKVSNIQQSEEMMEKIYKLVEERKPDFIVCLGDILDRHETIHVSPLTLAVKFLDHLRTLAPLYVIIGNHDRPNNSDFLSDRHPFSAAKKWDNTVVAETVKELTFDNTFRFIFVPYVPNGRFMEALDTIPNPLENTTAIFAHQEFFGAKMGAVVSKDGDKWPHTNPLVISGHIHDYQRPQTNIVYTGTPMQHAFGDQENKTINLYTFYSSEGLGGAMKWEEERVDLGLTKRTIVYLKPDEVITWQPPTDKLVKAVIRGSSAEIKAAMKLGYVKQLAKSGIKIVYKTIDDEENKIKDVSAIAPQVPYLQKLSDSVSTDKGQVEWFEKLFGSAQPSAEPQIQSSTSAPGTLTLSIVDS